MLSLCFLFLFFFSSLFYVRFFSFFIVCFFFCFRFFPFSFCLFFVFACVLFFFFSFFFLFLREGRAASPRVTVGRDTNQSVRGCKVNLATLRVATKE